ncbi:hypothetical protein Dimus_036652, partial [Dionaea muscipula]
RFARGLGYLFQILRWFYDGGLAPPALPRRRISFTEECQIALRAVPVSFGRPGESRRLRARRLGDAMEMTGVDTDVFSGLIYHRPSSGVAASVCGFSSHPDLGTFHDKSSSIADLGLIEEMGLPEDLASMEVMLPPVESGGSDDEVVRSVERSRALAPGHVKVCPPSSSDYRLVLGSTPEVDADGVEMLGVSVAVDDGAVAGEVCDGGLGIGVCQAAECLEVVDARAGDREVGIDAGRPTTGAVVSPFQLSLLAMGSPSSLIGVVSASGVGEGGSVREEGRAPTVAKKALRPQPTDATASSATGGVLANE